MSDKIDDMIAAGSQLEAYGEGGLPWSGCLTLIIAIAIAAAMIYIAGGV
jgi:hypothetical protein